MAKVDDADDDESIAVADDMAFIRILLMKICISRRLFKTPVWRALYLAFRVWKERDYVLVWFRLRSRSQQ